MELKYVAISPELADGLEILGEISDSFAAQESTHDKVVFGMFQILGAYGIRVYVEDKGIGDMTTEEVEEACRKYHLNVFMKDGRPLGFIEERRKI